MGFILDDLCVYIGVIVVWFAKGRKGSLWDKLGEVKGFDFFRRIEGVIGLVTIIATVCFLAVLVHFLR